MKTINAYHFVGETLRDGQPIPPNRKWLKYPGEVVMCQSGLHASRHPFDALSYSPGKTLCKVKVRCEVQEQNDKLVGRERLITARIDVEPVLRRFARRCALDVLHLIPNADPVIGRYLRTGDETLRAAAWAAAWAAAGAAAWATARAAAGAAAWAAAGAAAGAAARAAAGAAAGAKQRKRFARMVRREFAKAAT